MPPVDTPARCGPPCDLGDDVQQWWEHHLSCPLAKWWHNEMELTPDPPGTPDPPIRPLYATTWVPYLRDWADNLDRTRWFGGRFPVGKRFIMATAIRLVADKIERGFDRGVSDRRMP